MPRSAATRRITSDVIVRAASELRSSLVMVAARAASLQPPPNLCALLAELACIGGEITFSARRPPRSDR